MTDVVARIAKPQVILGITGLTAGLMRHRPGAAIRLLVSVPLTVAVSHVLKRLDPKQRPRLLDRHPRESFPSGHSAATTAYALALVDSYAAWWALPAAAAVIAAVNVARIEDREHWLTDVLSGDVIGAISAVTGSLVARWYMWASARRRSSDTSRKAAPASPRA
jgi:membrane-associated phospholipid phosphatase